MNSTHTNTKKWFFIIITMPDFINDKFGGFLVLVPYVFLVLEFQRKFQFHISWRWKIYTRFNSLKEFECVDILSLNNWICFIFWLLIQVFFELYKYYPIMLPKASNIISNVAKPAQMYNLVLILNIL